MRKWMKPAAAALLAGSLGLSASQAVLADTNAGYSRSTAYSYANPAKAAQPRWTADLGRPQTDLISDRVTVAGDRVVASKAGAVVALNLQTGKTLWTYKTGSKGAGALLAEGDSVYFASESGQIVKLNAKTGKKAWSYKLPTPELPRIAADAGSLYAIAGKLIALDAASGKVKWTNSSVTTNGELRLQGDLILMPTFESGAITVDTEYAIDRKTGKNLWKLSGSHRYLGSVKGLFYYLDTWPRNDTTEYVASIDVVDPATGKIVEKKSYLPVDPNKDPLIQAPRQVVLDGEELYIQDADGLIHRLKPGDAGTASKGQVLSSSGQWIAGPYAGRLFFEREGEDGLGVKGSKIFDGTTVYYEGMDNPVSRLDLIGSGLYVAQTDGKVIAANAATGKAQFRFQTSSRAFGPFKVSGKTLLVQSEDKLYAFNVPASLLTK